MLFNSIDFAIFIPIVFFLYWFVANKNLKLQNLLIVVSSYVFYGWWDWRFMFLLMTYSFVNYFVGIGLFEVQRETKRKMLLWTSILINLGLLAFFKYYDFFLANFIVAFSFFGMEFSVKSLNIVLPIGISFYTFQTMSYSIDVYRQQLTPTKNFIDFCAFASFFPTILAGPIERATNLLHQFYDKRIFDYHAAVDGLKQILWGLFKKVVIADSCATYANMIFDNSSNYSGSTLILGALFFTFQIYCDFSGYSDIAIGTAKLFGFKLTRNFNFPYFSKDISEFWRRWHISLSSWLNDYLFLPLNMYLRDLKKIGTAISISITFLMCGLWHGSNWTYIVWGAIYAVYYVPLIFLRTSRENKEIVAKGKVLPSLRDLLKILITFTLTVFAWIFFRAESLSHAVSYIKGIFSVSLISMPTIFPLPIIILTILFLILEWFGRENEYAIEKLWMNHPRFVRWCFYYGVVILIFIYAGKKQQFIYFQF